MQYVLTCSACMCLLMMCKKKKKSQQQQTYKEVFTSLVGIFNKQMLIKSKKRARLRVNVQKY